MTVDLQPTAATLVLPQPYLLFLGDVTEAGFAKTAFGLRDWAADQCVGEYALPGATVTTGLVQLTPEQAVARGARSMLIGVANQGGVIPPSWRASLVEALHAGLDVVSGMHARLADIPGLGDEAARLGRRLVDVRVPPATLPIATGRKRPGMRLLTVGTDCALGKKYTALALARAFAERGVRADFRATGQTGIMIAGGGIPMDAVIADFEAGAAEMLSPDADPGHWDVIEGQGSLFHPSFAGVSTGLLHGAQPEAIVLCHEPGRPHIRLLPGRRLPGLAECLERNLQVARLTSPDVRAVGVCLNTSGMDVAAAERLCAHTEDALGLPCTDPFAFGVETIIDELLCLALSKRSTTASR
jgi:uncharacterized NAD-dependent epimerase/dehydratase family protein